MVDYENRSAYEKCQLAFCPDSLHAADITSVFLGGKEWENCARFCVPDRHQEIIRESELI